MSHLAVFCSSAAFFACGLLLVGCQDGSSSGGHAAAGLANAEPAVAASQGASSSASSISEEALYARLRALPDFEQHFMVLAVANRVHENDANLERDTPNHALDALKVEAFELRTIAHLAKEARWNELAVLFDEASQRFVGVIRGEISNASKKVKEQDWGRRYKAAIASYEQEHNSDLRYTPSAEFLPLRDNLATYVGAGARLAIWQPEIDKKRAAEAAGAPPSKWSAATRKSIAQDVMEQRDKAIAARDALMTIPKSEHIVALMESGGNLNVLLKGHLAKSKQESPAALNATLRIGAFALDQLSDLALRMGFSDIAKCHTQEALQLRQLAQGGKPKPVGCRPKIYPASAKADLVHLNSTGDLAELDKLTKEWAKQTWMSGYATVTYDQHAATDPAEG